MVAADVSRLSILEISFDIGADSHPLLQVLRQSPLRCPRPPVFRSSYCGGWTSSGRNELCNGKRTPRTSSAPERRGDGAAETVSILARRSILLPLLREVEERAGERRSVFIGNSPLLNPLPARSSRGEEEAKPGFETVSDDEEELPA